MSDKLYEALFKEAANAQLEKGRVSDELRSALIDEARSYIAREAKRKLFPLIDETIGNILMQVVCDQREHKATDPVIFAVIRFTNELSAYLQYFLEQATHGWCQPIHYENDESIYDPSVHDGMPPNDEEAAADSQQD